MRALQLVSDRKLEITDFRRRPRPAKAKSRSRRMRSRSTISTCGAGAAWPSPSASCRSSSARGRGRQSSRSARASTTEDRDDPVALFGAETCGICKACLAGRDNLCENVRRHPRLSCRRARARADQPARRGSPCRRRQAFASSPRRLRAGDVRHVRAHAVRQRRSSPPGRPFSCRPAAAASAPPRSSSPRRSAPPSSPPSATTRRSPRRRRSAPTTSSTTARTASRAWCASSPRSKASTSSSSTSARIPWRARMFSLKRGGRAGHLRLDHRAVGQDQSVPALPAAI